MSSIFLSDILPSNSSFCHSIMFPFHPPCLPSSPVPFLIHLFPLFFLPSISPLHFFLLGLPSYLLHPFIHPSCPPRYPSFSSSTSPLHFFLLGLHYIYLPSSDIRSSTLPVRHVTLPSLLPSLLSTFLPFHFVYLATLFHPSTIYLYSLSIPQSTLPSTCLPFHYIYLL